MTSDLTRQEIALLVAIHACPRHSASWHSVELRMFQRLQGRGLIKGDRSKMVRGMPPDDAFTLRWSLTTSGEETLLALAARQHEEEELARLRRA